MSLVDILVNRASPSDDFRFTAVRIAESYVGHLKKSTKEVLQPDSLVFDDLGLDSLENVQVMMVVDEELDLVGDVEKYISSSDVSTVYSNFYAMCRACTENDLKPSVFDPVSDLSTFVYSRVIGFHDYDKALSVAKSVVTIVPDNDFRSTSFELGDLNLQKYDLEKVKNKLYKELGLYIPIAELPDHTMQSLAMKAYNP